MAGFTKLFNSILDSTIWQEPNETRILWITMLAMCDARGEVQASIPGLARRAGISLPECESGISILSSPDSYSRTKDHEGRRIQEIDGGWVLLNHGRYRALLSAEERKEYNRKKQAEFRASRKSHVNDTSMTVNDNKQCQHISEAEAEAEALTQTSLLSVCTDGNASIMDLEELWLEFPPTSRNRSSRKKLMSAWKKTIRKPSLAIVIESARKWAGCHDWTKEGGQYAPGAHLWINDRKWECDPLPVNHAKDGAQKQPDHRKRGYQENLQLP